MTIKEWDGHWTKVSDRAVFRGKTPNQAVVVANANTTKSLGARPVEVRE